MPPFDRHVFICSNRREAGHPRGCCNPTGAEALHKAFKKALAERGLQRRVRANKSGCLDQCEHGPTVVVYPDAVWYGGVTLSRRRRDRRPAPGRRRAGRTPAPGRRLRQHRNLCPQAAPAGIA